MQDKVKEVPHTMYSTTQLKFMVGISHIVVLIFDINLYKISTQQYNYSMYCDKIEPPLNIQQILS